MNREDVIRLAKEAAQGQPISRHLYCGLILSAWSEFLCKFAALVAADTLECCAKLADDEFGELTVLGDGIYNQLGDAEKTAQNIAKAIRELKDE